jgi:phosphatidylglycerophosphate synthase
LKWLTVPNMLSLSRIVFLPLLIWLLYSSHLYWFLAAYVLLASTDLFDGVLARKLGQVSHLGKELDSLADLFFYIASAYFIYFLYPDVILANKIYLIIFFSLLGFSFILSGILFRRPVMMHTRILRLNAVLVSLVVVTSTWFDTIYFTRFVIFLYYIGFIEEILIFIIYGNVNPDTKSIIDLMKTGNKNHPA